MARIAWFLRQSVVGHRPSMPKAIDSSARQAETFPIARVPRESVASSRHPAQVRRGRLVFDPQLDPRIALGRLLGARELLAFNLRLLDQTQPLITSSHERFEHRLERLAMTEEPPQEHEPDGFRALSLTGALPRRLRGQLGWRPHSSRCGDSMPISA